MNKTNEKQIISRWAKAGAQFGVKPSRQSPDLERLLLDTARLCAGNSRLFILAVTWLAIYSNYIARHRLKYLVNTELEPQEQAVLGLLVSIAIKHGASSSLRTATEDCSPLSNPRPLFDIDRSSDFIAQLVEEDATDESRKWGLWVQPIELKRDAIRPVNWLLKNNPNYRDRIIRKGDLRCSILEVLRRDAPNGRVPSESALARLCAANRTAVRSSLDGLESEGYSLRGESINERDTPVVLDEAA